MRCPLTIVNQRKVLCIFLAYAPSFGTFSHAYRLIGRVRAFMPPDRSHEDPSPGLTRKRGNWQWSRDGER
jgi:hypothetical protein